MSEANVEIVKRALDAYNGGGLDALMSFVAPDVEAFPDASVFPEAGPLDGRDEYERWLEETESAWVKVQLVVREVIAVEDGHVLVRGRLSRSS